MSHLSSIKEIGDATLEGRTRTNLWYKRPAQATTAGVWFDMSGTPGNPVSKYWFDAPPGIAKAVYQSTDGGIFHGDNVSPATKYLKSTTTTAPAATSLPQAFILCDYLLYYPTIDDSVTDPQILDNTVTLPRYTDGKGVQVIAVNLATRTGGQQFYFTYTNSDGIAGRVSQIHTQNAFGNLGNLTASNTATLQSSGNPFLGLQNGDTGVRSIQSVTMLGADTGLFSLILVKPLATTQLLEQTAPVEKDYLLDGNSIPIIEDDAFLGWLTNGIATMSNTDYKGDLTVVWN